MQYSAGEALLIIASWSSFLVLKLVQFRNHILTFLRSAKPPDPPLSVPLSSPARSSSFSLVDSVESVSSTSRTSEMVFFSLLGPSGSTVFPSAASTPDLSSLPQLRSILPVLTQTSLTRSTLPARRSQRSPTRRSSTRVERRSRFVLSV